MQVIINITIQNNESIDAESAVHLTASGEVLEWVSCNAISLTN